MLTEIHTKTYVGTPNKTLAENLSSHIRVCKHGSKTLHGVGLTTDKCAATLQLGGTKTQFPVSVLFRPSSFGRFVGFRLLLLLLGEWKFEEGIERFQFSFERFLCQTEHSRILKTAVFVECDVLVALSWVIS